MHHRPDQSVVRSTYHWTGGSDGARLTIHRLKSVIGIKHQNGRSTDDGCYTSFTT